MTACCQCHPLRRREGEEEEQDDGKLKRDGTASFVEHVSRFVVLVVNLSLPLMLQVNVERAIVVLCCCGDEAVEVGR